MPTYLTMGRMLELGWMPPEGFKLSPLDQELFDEMHPPTKAPENGAYMVSPTGKKIVGALETMTVYREISNHSYKDGDVDYAIDYMKSILHPLKRKIRLFVDEDGAEWLARELVVGERPLGKVPLKD